MKSEQTRAKRFGMNAGVARPLSDGKRSTFEGQIPVAHGVIRLLDGQCPLAIFRAIWTIVVASLDHVTRRWPWPHVSQECREVVQPSVTDANTASAVARIPTRVRIAAALFHLAPNKVFGRAFSAVLVGALTALLLVQASTALGVTGFEMSADNNADLAATTPTAPLNPLMRVGGSAFEHRQPSEVLAGEVLERRHGEIVAA